MMNKKLKNIKNSKNVTEQIFVCPKF